MQQMRWSHKNTHIHIYIRTNIRAWNVFTTIFCQFLLLLWRVSAFRLCTCIYTYIHYIYIHIYLYFRLVAFLHNCKRNLRWADVHCLLICAPGDERVVQSMSKCLTITQDGGTNWIFLPRWNCCSHWMSCSLCVYICICICLCKYLISIQLVFYLDFNDEKIF